MIVELMDLIRNFPGEANRTRCFAHIINLVAKSLLKQFDAPKKNSDGALDDSEKALQELAEGLDLEELETRLEVQMDGEDSDDDDGLVDEVARMSQDEQKELNESIRPVKLALVKVTFKLTYCDHLHTSNHALIAPKVSVQDNPLHDDPAASMEDSPWGAEDDNPKHPA
jgi:hypothetical protein